MVVTIETLVKEKKVKSTQIITAIDCEYCQEPYKKIWLFDGLIYLQIEHADGLHYLNVVPNGGSEDVGFSSSILHNVFTLIVVINLPPRYFL